MFDVSRPMPNSPIHWEDENLSLSTLVGEYIDHWGVQQEGLIVSVEDKRHDYPTTCIRMVGDLSCPIFRWRVIAAYKRMNEIPF